MHTFMLVLFSPITIPSYIGIYLLGTLGLSGPAYVTSMFSEGRPIEEPIHLVAGPDYFSIKVDLPLTDDSLWFYTGDEAERSGSVDENTWTFRISDFGDTVDLDGHESGENCFSRKYGNPEPSISECKVPGPGFRYSD